MQRDLLAGIFRNVQPVMCGVRCARRNQMYVYRSAIRPGISFVDRVPVRIDEQRLVEMRAFFHRALAVLLDLTTPEERLTLFIDRLQLEPNIECVDRSAGKEVPDLARSNDYVDPHIVAAAHSSIHAAERRGDRPGFTSRTARQRGIRFLAHREARG